MNNHVVKVDRSLIKRILGDCIEKFNMAEKHFIADGFNFEELKLTHSLGVVYIICRDVKNSEKVFYVGKSKGAYFKSRLRSHFFGIGKGTVSRYSNVKEGKYYLKFIHVDPPSLRNLIEEELIEQYKKENQPLWNYKT